MMKVKHRFRFYPAPPQKRALERTFGCVRVAFNRALAFRRDTYKATGKGPSFGDTSAELTKWKQLPELAYLNEVSCVPLQQTLRHLQSAYTNFFSGRTRYPRFKSKHGEQSAEYTRSAFKWDAANQNLTIAKVGRLRIRWSRDLTTEPSTVTITKDCAGNYFVTVTVEEDRQPLPPNSDAVGIDLGLKTLAVLSNGQKIETLEILKRNLQRLASAQRVLARRKKGSGRQATQRVKVARLHARVANARKDYLDKATTDIVRRFGTISLEDLNVRGMVKNRRLARSISDAGFGTFRRMLEYKSAWYGRTLKVCKPFEPTSKRCHKCETVRPTLKLSDREWQCLHCGTQHDRDLNAALNILAAGHVVTVRGESVSRRPASAGCRSSRRSANQPALCKAL